MLSRKRLGARRIAARLARPSVTTIGDEHADAAAVTTATARKLPRQPIIAAANASGAVASRRPMLPIPICIPVSVANRSGGNRRA